MQNRKGNMILFYVYVCIIYFQTKYVVFKFLIISHEKSWVHTSRWKDTDWSCWQVYCSSSTWGVCHFQIYLVPPFPLLDHFSVREVSQFKFLRKNKWFVCVKITHREFTNEIQTIILTLLMRFKLKIKPHPATTNVI